MQRESGGRDNSNSLSPFDRLRGVVSRIFGRKDPSENMSESSTLHPGTAPADSQPVAKSKEPVIVELENDDEGDVEREAEEEEGGVSGSRMNREKAQANAWANANPLVEHPDDQPGDLNKSNNISKDVAHQLKAKENDRAPARSQSVSYRRVTYGGINGAYYTATTTRRTGSDGVVLEDSKQADITTGQATHRISRGIHEKGHSLTRRLDSDGKVNTMQTLHNLEEDELAGFEQTWKGTADKHLPGTADKHLPGWNNLPGWNSGLDVHANAGTSSQWMTNWNPEFRDPFGGPRPKSNPQPVPLQGRPKKVVTINIE